MLEVVRQDNLQQRPFDEAIRQFGAAVASDRGIQATLNAAIDQGMSRDDWVALYVRLAGERGLHFSAEQLQVAMQEQKQGKDKILPSAVQKMVSLL